MKKLLIALLVLVLSIASFGCGGSADQKTDSSSADSGKKEIKIAYLTPSLDLPFWKYFGDGIKQVAAKSENFNTTVEIYDSKNDASVQLKNAQDAIVKQVDAIIISPTDSSSCPAVLKAAKEADIPVIIGDIGTDSGDYASFVITNNKDGAKEVGEYLVKYLKDQGITSGEMAQITISLARNNGKNRTAGFQEAIEAGGFSIVDIKQLEKYTRAEAEGFTQDLVTAHPNLIAIFGQTDEPTLGILKGVKSSGKDVIVVGFDATPETIDEIRAGSILAAAVQQPVLMGVKCYEAVEQIMMGQTPEKEISIPTILVTKDNIEEKQAELDKNVFPAE